MDGKFVADDHLYDSIDITAAGADITDPGRAASGCEFKYNFLQVCEAVEFSRHILRRKARYLPIALYLPNARLRIDFF